MHSDPNLQVVALVGAPNSGKTTLFNWMSGAKFRAVNYPGATVDCFRARTQDRFGPSLEIIDTPGTYSLFPKSPEEEVTRSALFHNRLGMDITEVIVVVDATQLDRQLYLVHQLVASGMKTIVALTMMDLVRAAGKSIDVKKLSQSLGTVVVPIDGRLGGGVEELVEKARTMKEALTELPKLSVPESWPAEKIQEIHKKSKALSQEVTIQKDPNSLNASHRTRQLDRWLLHPVWGLGLFVATMSLLFSSIFWLAAPFMEYVDLAFSWVAEALLNFESEALWADLLANGVILSFGSVFVFVPQIFILFIGISLLEDSGYLARAATVVDRPFSWLGLSGRSFVPLLSGFACAVPAMMATRNIRGAKERWLTMFIIPLMTCSARLPVYALLLSFIFLDQAAWKPGVLLAVIYLGSLLLGGIAAYILGKFVKIPDSSLFMMELPLYRRPQLRVVLRTAVLRTKSYIRRAGPVIFTLALLIWGASSFPRPFAQEDFSQSYLGQAGHWIEPVFEPMGLDWRAGVGLLSSFAAREVFVSTLAIVMNVSESEEEDTLQQGLLHQMRTAKTAEGEPVFTVASVTGLIVFFMIALQCMSTVAMAQREMASTKFAVGQLVGLTLWAYVLAVAVVQGLRAFGVN